MSASPYEFYSPQYARFGSDIASEIRREVFGKDLGQTSWRSLEEDARIATLVRGLDPAHVLDIACGSGGPSIALVEATHCRLIGIDIEPAAIDQARQLANVHGLTNRVRFEIADCNEALPFQTASFDAVICIDAILHLADRAAALRDWSRLLRPGGLLVFTDAAVLTGPISREEIDIRASQGPFVIVPPGANEKTIEAAGLVLRQRQDTTQAIAQIAARLHLARDRRSAPLLEAEGNEWFAARQRFLQTASKLAAEGRLSRHFYLAEKPA